MKGLVLLKNCKETFKMFDSALSVVNSLSTDDMKVDIEKTTKWSFDKLFTSILGFYKEEKEIKVWNFLMKDKKRVIKHINQLKDMINSGSDVYVSLLSYNELVKLSKGNIEINTCYLLDY